MKMFENLYDFLYEKGTNPETKDQVCLEVAPRKEGDYLEYTYGYHDEGEEVIFTYNQVGKVTYAEFLELTNLFLKQQKFIREKDGLDELPFTPLTICKKVFLDYIAIFIANLKMHTIPVLFPSIIGDIPFDEFKKYNHFFTNKPADFYLFSSGSTGILNKPKPAYEKDIINSVYYDFMVKNKIENEKFYSTMSMNGIAGVTFNAFFPIITNNQVYINDNTDFFENISQTKSTMFILPLNYMDFLPLKKNDYDFSHVKYILISGGYFNSNDINNLLNSLPGLKKEAIIYLYSSTELEGKSVSCTYHDLEPISLSMPDLLNNKVTFKSGFDCTEYLASGIINKDFCQIIDDSGKILDDDMLGTIRMNNNLTEDLGIIHHNKLYVIGRKSKNNEKYNLSILNNYFRYHLNNDVACGIYNDELIVYLDIINNYYGAYTKNPSTRRGVYECYKDNFILRDNANALIKYLEDNYDIEFFGDAILHKFMRNERLEKINFNYQKYHPFNYDFNDINGANLFDTYYFIAAHFEELFVLEVVNILYNNIIVDPDDMKTLQEIDMLMAQKKGTGIPLDSYIISNYLKNIPIRRIYDCIKKIHDNKEIIDKMKNNPDLFKMMEEVLFIPSYLSLDFIDMHHFDKNHSNIKAKDIREWFKLRPILNDEEKSLVRDLVCIIRDLQNKFDINIYSKEYYSPEMKERRNERMRSNPNGMFLDLFENIIDNAEYKVNKKNYHWMWRS